MKVDLVRAPFLLGSVVAGILVNLALLSIVTGTTWWDDHLINAAGVFGAGLLITVVLHLVIGAFRPPPGTHKRARLIKFVLLIALLLVGAVVFTVAWFLSNLSFV